MPYLSPEEQQAYAYQQYQHSVPGVYNTPMPGETYVPPTSAQAGQALASLATGFAIPAAAAAASMGAMMFPSNWIGEAGRGIGQAVGGTLAGAGGGIQRAAVNASVGLPQGVRSALGISGLTRMGPRLTPLASTGLAKGLGTVGMLGGYALGMAPMFAASTAAQYVSGQVISGQREFLATREMLRELPGSSPFGTQSMLGGGMPSGMSLSKNPLNSLQMQGTISDLSHRYGASTAQMRNLTSALGQSHGALDTRSIESTSQSLRRSMAELSSIAKRIDGDLEEAYEVYEGLRRMGFSSQGSRASALRGLQSVSSLTGMSVRDVSGLASSAMSMADQFGVSRSSAYRSSLTNLSTAAVRGSMGHINQRYLRSVGGIQGYAARMTELELGMAGTHGFQEMMSALYNPDGTTREQGSRPHLAGRNLARRRFFRDLDPYELSDMTESMSENMPTNVFRRIHHIRSGARNPGQANRRQYEFLSSLGISDPNEQLEFLRNLSGRGHGLMAQAAQSMRDDQALRDVFPEQDKQTVSRALSDAVKEIARRVFGNFGEELERFGSALQVRSERLSSMIGNALGGGTRSYAPINFGTQEMAAVGASLRGGDLRALQNSQSLFYGAVAEGNVNPNLMYSAGINPTANRASLDFSQGPYGIWGNRVLYDTSVSFRRVQQRLSSDIRSAVGLRPSGADLNRSSLGEAFSSLTGTDSLGAITGRDSSGRAIRQNEMQYLQAIGLDHGVIYGGGMIHRGSRDEVEDLRRGTNTAARSLGADTSMFRGLNDRLRNYSDEAGVSPGQRIPDHVRRRLQGDVTGLLDWAARDVAGEESFQSLMATNPGRAGSLLQALRESDDFGELLSSFFPEGSEMGAPELYATALREAQRGLRSQFTGGPGGVHMTAGMTSAVRGSRLYRTAGIEIGEREFMSRGLVNINRALGSGLSGNMDLINAASEDGVLRLYGETHRRGVSGHMQERSFSPLDIQLATSLDGIEDEVVQAVRDLAIGSQELREMLGFGQRGGLGSLEDSAALRRAVAGLPENVRLDAVNQLRVAGQTRGIDNVFMPVSDAVGAISQLGNERQSSLERRLFRGAGERIVLGPDRIRESVVGSPFAKIHQDTIDQMTPQELRTLSSVAIAATYGSGDLSSRALAYLDQAEEGERGHALAAAFAVANMGDNPSRSMDQLAETLRARGASEDEIRQARSNASSATIRAALRTPRVGDDLQRLERRDREQMRGLGQTADALSSLRETETLLNYQGALERSTEQALRGMFRQMSSDDFSRLMDPIHQAMEGMEAGGDRSSGVAALDRLQQALTDSRGDMNAFRDAVRGDPNLREAIQVLERTMQGSGAGTQAAELAGLLGINQSGEEQRSMDQAFNIFSQGGAGRERLLASGVGDSDLLALFGQGGSARDVARMLSERGYQGVLGDLDINTVAQNFVSGEEGGAGVSELIRVALAQTSPENRQRLQREEREDQVRADVSEIRKVLTDVRGFPVRDVGGTSPPTQEST